MVQQSVNTGIPTIYGGCRYRSRLKAKWAAFFDMFGWEYQYEPWDGAGWIPDFALFGTYEILVEIKPYSSFEEFRNNKITDEIVNALSLGKKWGAEVLLLGSRIFRDRHRFQFGWLGEPVIFRDAEGDVESNEYSFDLALLGVAGNRWDFHGDTGDFHGRITNYYEKRQLECNPDHAEGIWREAGNRVQWKAAL